MAQTILHIAIIAALVACPYACDGDDCVGERHEHEFAAVCQTASDAADTATSNDPSRQRPLPGHDCPSNGNCICCGAIKPQGENTSVGPLSLSLSALSPETASSRIAEPHDRFQRTPAVEPAHPAGRTLRAWIASLTC